MTVRNTLEPICDAHAAAAEVAPALVTAHRSAALRIAACAAALLALTPGRQAFAADADCKPLFEAMTRLFNTPSHQYLTQTSADPGEKPTVGEIINTGKIVYILVEGKWQKSTITAAQLQEQEEQNRKNAKVRICRLERDESVDGVAVKHFSAHTETGDVISEEQIWISKSAGLPVRETIDMDMGDKGGKSRAEIRVIYTGIEVPAVAR
jgi:hypothetical protein